MFCGGFVRRLAHGAQPTRFAPLAAATARTPNSKASESDTNSFERAVVPPQLPASGTPHASLPRLALLKQPIPIYRKLELTVAWGAVALALIASLFGFVGPHLGGADPGLRGPLGYAMEMVASAWFVGGLLAAVAALGAAARRLRAPAAILGVVALAFLGPDLWARWTSRPSMRETSAPVLRVASVNLAAWNKRDALMRKSLRELDADVLVLSEYTHFWAGRLDDWFPNDYPHRILAAPVPVPGLALDGQRQAVWSRIEPSGPAEELKFGGFPVQVRVPVYFEGRELALYGIHSRVPHPRYAYDGAWRHRRKILNWMRAEELPAILAGDFNSPMRSAYMQRVRDLGFTSASDAVHGRSLDTWPMRPPRSSLLHIAIDHILSSEELAATHYQAGPPTRSDHKPILAVFVWESV